MSDTDELETLRRRCADFERQLFAAGITATTEPDLPTPSELRKLRGIVVAAYPVLKCPPTINAGADHAAFEAAFRFLCVAERAEEPSDRFSISFWYDMCSEWMRKRGIVGDVTAHSFLSAALAHADIHHRCDPHRLVEPALGLMRGEHVGRRYASKWRTVLATGVLLPPTVQHARRPREQPSPVKIEGGNARVGGEPWRGVAGQVGFGGE